MASMRATVPACLAVLLLLGQALWSLTGGLDHWTYESLRRAQASSAALKAAELTLRDSADLRHRPWTHAANHAPQRVLIVDFIYTRCPTVCQVLGSAYQQMQSQLEADRGEGVRLLSISFDVEHDDAAALGSHARVHRAEARRWRVTAPTDAGDAQALLRSLGVVVIADGWGGYVHNAALHLIDEQGRLRAIYDHDDWPRALAHARRIASEGAP